MNRFHNWYCHSQTWKKKLEREILPWALRDVRLGPEVLELGPGPGLTTEWLRGHCNRLTCIEVDRELATALSRRARNSNVQVQCGDATAMPYRDQTFSSVVCFTMLHHVPSSTLQDSIFAEVHRVLKPNGIFAGTDSTSSILMKIFHIGDTLVLIDPSDLRARLETAGFGDVKVELGKGRFRFRARKNDQF